MNIKDQVSFKRLALSKANTQMLAVAAVAAFVTVFCLGAANYFWGLRSYQAKIISSDTVADNNLKADVRAKNQLENSYLKFANKTPNLINQNNSGFIMGPNGQKYSYNNAIIVLDALPSRYDFPALTASIQSFLQRQNLDITAISGTDQTGSVTTKPSGNPQLVSIPFSFTVVNASYSAVQNLLKNMMESIRPLTIDKMTLSGTDSSMTVTINAHTYFQPGKEFKIGTETIAR